MSDRPHRRSIVVATRNQHKLGELGEILAGADLEPLPDSVVLPPEDGETFAENALGKARAAHEQTGMAALADDSGIAAAALGGRPGVRSARYAGEDATDEENLALLLEEVGPGDDRSVAFVCAIAFVGETGEETVCEARCEGTLAEEPRGDGGFGYDPAFVPVEIGDGRTMAELRPEEKHAISHRGRAARAIADTVDGLR
ncbi:MAG: RdgB/HAM1 family non-canonical purine NTP pyrophosphatase [Solirubrobacterales bacterium]